LVACSARGPFHVTPDTRGGSQPTFGSPQAQPGAESLEKFIEKVRKASLEAKPPERKPVVQAESIDPQLTAALAVAAAHPSPAAYRAVAYEYRRLEVADKAHEYLDKAAALAPRDSTTYDFRARMWRDGGLTDRALADAHRAVYYAPSSAAAHNTLGTVLQALGRHGEARKEYERAVALDPSAAYALNNLCYTWMLQHQPAKAVAACKAAIQLEPGLRSARNNLGLAYAAAGNMEAARAAFEAAGDRAAAEYNVGIVQLARHHYADAVTAFATAQQIRPNWRIAAARTRQAQTLAKAGAEE
jgi:Flp pilus assembly protein TadD